MTPSPRSSQRYQSLPSWREVRPSSTCAPTRLAPRLAAFLSDEAADRYKAAPHRLSMPDWKSGDQLRLIDVFAPFGGAAYVLKDLQAKVLASCNIQLLVPVQGQEAKVIEWPARA